MTRWILTAVLTLLVASPAFGLNVRDVIEMTEAGLGDDVIINQIRATHSRFDLTVDEIIALSEAGISDAVLAHMIATAFDIDEEYDTTYDEYGDDDGYRKQYTVIEDEPVTQTYVHLGLGYQRPWTSIWWDYWWPSWDYYWYCDAWWGPTWGWRYRPWHYSHYYGGCYLSDWCDPCIRYDWWGDPCDRYCRLDTRRDRVRWGTPTLAPRVTLAHAKTRTKAIRDAQKGRIHSPLAQLESVRTKSTKARQPILASSKAGTYKQYGRTTDKSRAGPIIARGEKSKKSSAKVYSITTRGKDPKSKAGPKSRVSITKRSSRKSERAAPAVRPSNKRSDSSRKAPSYTRKSTKSSNQSSKATQSSSSVRSKSGSKKSSPAKSSRSSSSQSGSSSKRSSGSKKGRK